MDKLLNHQKKYPGRYFNKILDDNEIICFPAPCDDWDMQGKFDLTNSMIWPTLHRFHGILGHPGTCCIHSTLQAKYHHLHLWMHIEQFLQDKCQCAKPNRYGHRLHPDRDIAGAPWKEVTVDLITHGLHQPHMVMWTSLFIHSLKPQLTLSKLQGTLRNLALTLLHVLGTPWLSCYPKPMQVIDDNGGEWRNHWVCLPIAVTVVEHKIGPDHNSSPQSNTVCKKMHQTVATVLTTLLLPQPPQTSCQAVLFEDDALDTGMHALLSWKCCRYVDGMLMADQNVVEFLWPCNLLWRRFSEIHCNQGIPDMTGRKKFWIVLFFTFLYKRSNLHEMKKKACLEVHFLP